ncbi:MAG TPA: V-type ATP synthase subunit I [Clostridia bacterium]|nr:V-type ATP synthase subunit I [Clostridia bacterium]
MPILQMKKFTLMGLISEKENLFTALSRTKKVHLINMEEIEDTSRNLNVEKTDILIKKMNQIDGAISFMKNAMDIKQAAMRARGDKKAKFAIKTTGRKAEVGYTRFDQIADHEIGLFDNAVYTAEKYQHRITEIDGEISKFRQEAESLEIYKNLDIAFFDIKDTAHTATLLGIVQNFKKSDFETLVIDYPETQFAFIGEKGTDTAVMAITLKETEEQIREVLQKWNFSQSNFDFNVTAMEMIRHHHGKIERLKKEKEEILFTSCQKLLDYLPDLKLLYDYYSISLQLIESDTSICETKKVFLMQGWVATEDVETIKKVVAKNTTVCSEEYIDPTDDEKPPTVIKTNKIFAPFNSIIEMYSLPDYREASPNVFVAVFYWLFMGIMMGDVGYGVVMMLVAALFVKFIKPEGGMKNLVLIIGYSGVSTLIWGILFGGWFAISFPEGSIFSPVLLSPLTNPLGMIELCLILGTLHIISAMIMRAINLIRQKHYLDAVFDAFIWIIFDIGLILAIIGGFASLTGSAQNLSIFTNIGLIMMVVALVVVLLTAGRKKKGLGKITGGLGGVWGVIGLVSDILSYLRLFGLGLTTGVIGMVFNTLAGLLLGSPYFFLLGVVVLLFGHGLNLAINLLGAYVHDARLQHIEFFGKFYTGDGLRFSPLAGNTKYTKLLND